MENKKKYLEDISAKDLLDLKDIVGISILKQEKVKEEFIKEIGKAIKWQEECLERRKSNLAVLRSVEKKLKK